MPPPSSFSLTVTATSPQPLLEEEVVETSISAPTVNTPDSGIVIDGESCYDVT